MKTKVTKILLVFSITLLSLPALMAQKGVEDGSKYGHGEDSIRALQNLSMYKQFYRQKSYNDAIKPWRIVFNEAPRISKNMYIHGVNMYKIFFKNSKSVEEREKFVDTIMMIYDQRMEYFNSKGYLTARKGVDLGNLSPKRAKEAYDLIHEAVDMMDKQTPGFALNEMMQAALKLYNDDIISEDEMVNNFALASDILDYQMKNASSSKKRERYETIMNNVELIFTKSGAATCESLIPLLTKRYEEKPKDRELIQVSLKICNRKLQAALWGCWICSPVVRFLTPLFLLWVLCPTFLPQSLYSCSVWQFHISSACNGKVKAAEEKSIR